MMQMENGQKSLWNPEKDQTQKNDHILAVLEVPNMKLRLRIFGALKNLMSQLIGHFS